MYLPFQAASGSQAGVDAGAKVVCADDVCENTDELVALRSVESLWIEGANYALRDTGSERTNRSSCRASSTCRGWDVTAAVRVLFSEAGWIGQRYARPG